MSEVSLAYSVQAGQGSEEVFSTIVDNQTTRVSRHDDKRTEKE